MASHFNCLFSFSIVGSGCSGVLGLEDMNSFSLSLLVFEIVLWVELNEWFLHWDGISGSWSSTSGIINRVLSISSSRVRSSGLWVGVIVGDGSWFSLLAWGSWLSIFGSISTIAHVSSAVSSIGTVGSVTEGKGAWGRSDLNWVPLSIVEWLSLHGNVLTEIFITFHTFSELNEIASDSRNLVLHAWGINLDESSGWWPWLTKGRFIEIWVGISLLNETGSWWPWLTKCRFIEMRRCVIEGDSGGGSQKCSKDWCFH